MIQSDCDPVQVWLNEFNQQNAVYERAKKHNPIKNLFRFFTISRDCCKNLLPFTCQIFFYWPYWVIEFKLNLSFEMTFSQLDVVKCQAQNNCSISVFRNSGISTFTFLFQHPAFTFSLIKRLVEIIKVITQVATK